METRGVRRGVTGVIGLALLATAGTLTMVLAGAQQLSGSTATIDLALSETGSRWSPSPLVLPGSPLIRRPSTRVEGLPHLVGGGFGLDSLAPHLIVPSGPLPLVTVPGVATGSGAAIVPVAPAVRLPGPTWLTGGSAGAGYTAPGPGTAVKKVANKPTHKVAKAGHATRPKAAHAKATSPHGKPTAKTAKAPKSKAAKGKGRVRYS